MNDPGCPYLLRETLTWRESLDLSRKSPMRVAVVWRCGHPFHGLALELGEDAAEVRRRCAAGTLPRPDAAEGASPAGRARRSGVIDVRNSPDDGRRRRGRRV
jgi:hypothetical protein